MEGFSSEAKLDGSGLGISRLSVHSSLCSFRRPRLPATVRQAKLSMQRAALILRRDGVVQAWCWGVQGVPASGLHLGCLNYEVL